MTFSLAGRCARTGMLGLVVTSSSPAVAARCAWARAGTGAVATQNITDPSLGPAVLDLLGAGRSAAQALHDALAAARHAEYRQVAVVDSAGRTAARTGTRTLGRNSTAAGPDCVAAGNLLATEDVTAAMVAAFGQRPLEHLADRLLDALRAGAAAGGEEGPLHSAGLVVVDRVSWPVTDLRVDWHDDPVGELGRLWEVWKPQEGDYVRRAVDPASAPSYGVPGDA
ncbi:MAG TPA: DUF1028 domain-containing protein [Streptosporangiaceae bacterium]